MKRILIVQPSIQPPGGVGCVAAWVVEALRHHRLTLLQWEAPDLGLVNEYFGTSLRATDFSLRLPPLAVRRVVDALPTPSVFLRLSTLARYAQGVLRREAWDMVLSTHNEMDFGLRGMQYVHFPTFYEPRPDCDYRWYHRVFPFGLTGYRRGCRWLARCSPDGVRRNLSLVNSDWTGAKLRDFYGADSVTVHPPVPGDFRQRPWAEREDAFVCLGRISPEKEVDKVIEILARLRRGGRALRLHIVGSPDHGAYTQRILNLVEREREWIEVHFDLPRRQLVDLLAGQRYGIHGMVGEHFGIAVAEIQRAGGIVFVPDEGGQVEIVGGDQRLTYGSVEDAVEKIDRVLGDRELQASILRGVAARRDRFSAERFVAEIQALVAKFSST